MPEIEKKISIDRRCFMFGAAGLSVGAQRAAANQLKHLAILEGTSADGSDYYLAPLQQALQERGYMVDRSFRITHRFADGDAARYPALAAELIGAQPDIIVTGSTTATLACVRLTSRIPIISCNLTDPVGAGLIASYAKPGRNVTGVTVSLDGLPSKVIQLVQEVLPGIKTLGVVSNSNETAGRRQREEAERAAGRLGLTLVPAEVRSASDFHGSFRKLKQDGVQAVYAPSSLLVRTERRLFADAALAAAMPTFCNAVEVTQAGAMVSYGADLRENYRRAGYFVARVLGGASPADLPTENPTRFVCSINLRTAKALAISMPPALFALADEIIE